MIVSDLAKLVCAKGDLEGAESLYRRALEVRDRVEGPEGILTLFLDEIAVRQKEADEKRIGEAERQQQT